MSIHSFDGSETRPASVIHLTCDVLVGLRVGFIEVSTRSEGQAGIRARPREANECLNDGSGGNTWSNLILVRRMSKVGRL